MFRGQRHIHLRAIRRVGEILRVVETLMVRTGRVRIMEVFRSAAPVRDRLWWAHGRALDLAAQVTASEQENQGDQSAQTRTDEHQSKAVVRQIRGAGVEGDFVRSPLHGIDAEDSRATGENFATVSVTRESMGDD